MWWRIEGHLSGRMITENEQNGGHADGAEAELPMAIYFFLGDLPMVNGAMVMRIFFGSCKPGSGCCALFRI